MGLVRNPHFIKFFKLHIVAVALLSHAIEHVLRHEFFFYCTSVLFLPTTCMPELFGLSNSEGHTLAWELLHSHLRHDLHDYILEAICKAVDGIHVLLMVKTGGGKTSLFYGYALLLQALRELETPCPFLKRTSPSDPVLIAVYPTKGLEEEMVHTI